MPIALRLRPRVIDPEIVNRGRIALAALLLACSHGPHPAEAAQIAIPLPSHLSGEQGTWYISLAAQRSETERCIDRELRARSLNQFGDPMGMTYPPEDPVLALRNSADRYRHAMRRQPEIATSCTRAPGETYR